MPKPQAIEKKTAGEITHKDWAFDKDSVYIETGEDRVYFHAAEDNVICGLLIGSSSYVDEEEGRTVKHYLILTEQPCEIDTGEKDAPPEIAPAGTLVHLNERHQLIQLERLLEQPFYVRVSIQCVNQKSLKKGRKVWRFRIAFKPTKKPNAMRTTQNAATDSEIPF